MFENDDVAQPFLSTDEYNKDQQKISEDLDIAINRKIRNGFIVKVYGILLFQLLITFLVVLLGFVVPAFRAFLLKNITLIFYLTLACLIVILITLSCCLQSYRVFPTNYILLIFFTVSLSFNVATICCFYTPKTVLFTFLLTVITVIALTIYAWFSEKDYTICGGVLFVSLTLLIFGSFFIFIFNLTFLRFLLNIGGLILFSIYLIYDTQLLIGTKSSKFDEDDYILAAMNLYLDIINLFLELLKIFGRNN